MARLTKHEWLEVEELYRQGWTQRQLSEKFKIRIESISQHMKKEGIKGGEAIDVVRQEMEAALHRKVKEFAQKRANRQIDTKEKLHTLVNTLLGFYVKELKNAQESGHGLATVANAAKSLKESLLGLKLAREELYVLLDVKPDMDQEDTPDLLVMTMNDQDEARIRNSGGYSDDDDDIGFSEMEAAVAESNLSHDLEALQKEQEPKE